MKIKTPLLSLALVVPFGALWMALAIHHQAPSPSPTPPTVKAPHGIYEIGGDAWTNPNVSGWRAELKWNQSNPTEGVYDWKKTDGLVTNAGKYHKQLSVALIMLSQAPAWLQAKTKTYTYGKDTIVLPWDQIVRPYLLEYIKAFCEHFDGQLDHIVMGGMGVKTESYMPLPGDIGLPDTNTDFIAAWLSSSESLVDYYGLYLKTTPFILAQGVPFKDPGAIPALTSLVNHGLLLKNFGLMQWGLKATSNNGFLLNKFVQDNDAGRATGFQLTGSSDGSVGGDLQGTLEQALQAGQNLGADWIEVYAVDAMNPVYAAVLAKYNKLLK